MISLTVADEEAPGLSAPAGGSIFDEPMNLDEQRRSSGGGGFAPGQNPMKPGDGVDPTSATAAAVAAAAAALADAATTPSAGLQISSEFL